MQNQPKKSGKLLVIRQQLEKTNENLIEKNFIHSDDFIDIIQTIVDKITVRQAAQKADFFAT